MIFGRTKTMAKPMRKYLEEHEKKIEALIDTVERENVHLKSLLRWSVFHLEGPYYKDEERPVGLIDEAKDVLK
jgi:hypothetical protein